MKYILVDGVKCHISSKIEQTFTALKQRETEEEILSTNDWLAGTLTRNLYYSGYLVGPNILFLFLNLVIVKLMLSLITFSGYPLLINNSLITLSSPSILQSEQMFRALNERQLIKFSFLD